VSRASLFLVVVLVGAAAAAGMLALTRTSAVSRATGQSASAKPAISFRLKQLDRLETDLRRKVAVASKQVPSVATPQARTVYVRPPAIVVTRPHRGDDGAEQGGGSDD
jgi:hypothetical protein